MSIQVSLYRQEIYNYVATLSIKFSPFADLVAKYVAENTGHTIHTPAENPYYRNICGLYSFLDEQMYVRSVETQTDVPFNRALWEEYPKTAALYQVGTDEYQRLCDAYPTRTGLIKSIIYPCADVDTALAAPDFTILNHDPSFLRTNEQESMVAAVERLLKYYRERWFIRDFDFEDQYPIAAMTNLYTLLIGTLLAQRVRNLNTDSVHHMHVWDHLAANGLGNYEDILTDVQARFLYRNIRYLKSNRGRKTNLMILADNLLRDLKVSLVGKVIFQQNKDLNRDCTLIPEFLSEEIVSYDPNTLNNVDTNRIETMDNILYRIHHEGYYPVYSVPNSVLRETRFGRTQLNEVPTQILELKKYTINTEYLLYLAEFLYDSLLYQTSLGKTQFTLQFKDTNTAVLLKLTASDAIALLHYVLQRRFGEEPTTLPGHAVVRIPYKAVRPTAKELPTHLYFNNHNYIANGVLDTKKILSEIPWSDEIFYSETDFIRMLGNQFDVLVTHTRDAEASRDMLFQWLYYFYYRHLVVTARLKINLSKYRLYSDWIEYTPGIKTLLTAYERFPQPEVYYDQLANELLRKILPIELSPHLKEYVGAIYDDTPFYNKLKGLFVYLTSHDLEYLDTSREQLTNINMMPISVMTGGGTDTIESEIVDVGIDAIVKSIDSSTTVLDGVILDYVGTSGHETVTTADMISVDILKQKSSDTAEIQFYEAPGMTKTYGSDQYSGGTLLSVGPGLMSITPQK